MSKYNKRTNSSKCDMLSDSVMAGDVLSVLMMEQLSFLPCDFRNCILLFLSYEHNNNELNRRLFS